MPPAAIFLTAATPHAALPASGPWYVNEEDDLCTLGRRYPSGGQAITLLFKPLLDLPTMELFVISPDKSDRQYNGVFTVQIGAAGQRFTGSYFSVRTDKTNDRYTRLTIDRAAMDQLRDGDQLHVKAGPVDQTFTIVRPEKARLTLQGCVDELKKSWGMDTALQPDRATPLEGNPARYFNSESYPPEAFRNGVYGRVIAALTIDDTGVVTHCRIVSSAGPLLNEGTCKAAMHIRFKPPRDRENKPMSSSYILPVRWAMPGSPN